MNIDKAVAAIEAIISPPDETPVLPTNIYSILNAIRRGLYTNIDENKPEHRLAVGVIMQAISDYCNGDAYIPTPIYKRKEAYISGTQFLTGEGLRYWAAVAGLSHEDIYRAAAKTKEYLKNA